MIGMDIHKLYVDPSYRSTCQQELEKKGFIKDYEVHWRKKDGTKIGVILTLSVYWGKDGSIAGYRGIARDVTERKVLERQLLQAQKMKSIGTLTGGIAHDFNNLLTIMNGYTELILSEKTEDDPIYLDLQTILETGRKGAELVHRLLTLSNKSEITLRSCSLNFIAENSVVLIKRTIPKMIEIETIFTKNLAMVNADAGQIEQVLLNLCINAKDAMPEGGKLRIETQNVAVDEAYCRIHTEAKPGPCVLLEVVDTGTGMDQKTLDRMFDPFFTTKGWDFKKGTGLGLSMAKGIVEKHGGWITCESEPGKGTIFRIYFPAIIETPGVQKHEPKAEPVRGTGNILLVDDEEHVRDLGKRILERAGFTVMTASNGREALEIYSKEQTSIDLVVLDLIMPQMGGERCFEELIKINPQVRVIVSSGHSLTPEEQDRLGISAKGFVNKPYQIKQLLGVVSGVMDV
jgi:two-component system, cell cycle sensor histidine kinase and response regulator CckA